MYKNKIVGVVMAGGLLFAACGDDGGGSSSASSNEYSDAIAEAIQSEGDVPFSDDEVDCLARELVDAVGGPSTFEDAGVSAEDLAGTADLSESGLDIGEDEAKAVAASFGKCDINLTDAFLQDLGDDVPDEVRSCIEDNLDEDTFADLFADALVTGGEGDDLPPELLEDLTACIS
ncbi:hypothetical protein [Actinospongicola halichondriae]|uniref:hypothetical protein n=1 Tax=Actinospongicola halichondriae TaxID=3236844 RepID=UPI003D3C05BB